MATDLGIDGKRLGAIGSAWEDEGLWDDVLWLAARAWEDTDPDEHRHRWHHLVMAVGNFKRQVGRRLHPPRLRPAVLGESMRPQIFDVPVFGDLDRDDPATWQRLDLRGAATATKSTLLSAIWPGEHHVIDWRVFAATTALLLETPDDLGLVKPSDTHVLPEPTIAQYAVIRQNLKSVATASGVPLIKVERALYRLTKRVKKNPDRRWSTYRDDLLAAAEAWDVSEASEAQDAYGGGVQEDSTD